MFQISEDWSIDGDKLFYQEDKDEMYYEIKDVAYGPYQVEIKTDFGSLTLYRLAKNYVGLHCDMDVDSYSQPIKMKWKAFIKSLF